MNEEVVFTGMLAELIILLAERNGLSPSDYVISLFDKGCNAPDGAKPSFVAEGAMHQRGKLPPVAGCAAGGEQQADNSKKGKR